MPATSRIGDTGVGFCYCCDPFFPPLVTVVLITGAKSPSSSESSPNSRVTDMVMSLSCGHTALMISGSNDVSTEKKPDVRIGDSFSGCIIGQLITGAKKVFDNGGQ